MAAERIPIVIPRGGVSEDRAYADQDQNTSQDAHDVRGVDPGTGRERLSVRAGTRRLNDSQINGAAKIERLAAITYGKSNQALSDPGNALTTEWSKGNTVSGDTIGVKCGTQGDVIVIDGNCGITKRNRDGELLWKIALAAVDKNHAVRALHVDASTPDGLGSDVVLAGISSGGDSTTAKCWMYRQLNDNKVEKVWEMSLGGYVEEFAISKDKLFVLANYPDKNRAQVIVFDDYLTNTPTEINRWDAPHPGTSIDAGPQDGFIFTTHGANADRDRRGGHQGSTWDSSDYALKDLPNYKEAVWTDLRADVEETLALSPRSLEYPGSTGDDFAPPGENLDGANVRAWVDFFGSGRNFYQTAEQIPNATGSTYAKSTNPASRGAIYKKFGGPNGKGVLHFDGLTTGMISEKPFSVDKANRLENLCVIPSYKGAQHIVIIVARASCDRVRRALISQGADPATNTTNVRWIGVNSVAGAALSTGVTNVASMDGSVSLFEDGGVAGDAGKSPDEPFALGTPNSRPCGQGLPGSGWAVYTWVCDGGIHDHATNATRSQFRVNGMPCDRWQSGPFSTLEATRLGYYTRSSEVTAGFVGDIARVLVLSDWVDKDGIQQPLLGSGGDLAMRYPDTPWNTNQDSNIERLEGMVAHEYGIAHELPGGSYGVLRLNVLPVVDTTVTIGVAGPTQKVYRWRDTLAQENDVARGATFDRSLVNLWRAINGIGEPDADYHRNTTPHTVFRALAPTQRPSIEFSGAVVTDGGGGPTLLDVAAFGEFATGGLLVGANIVFVSTTGGAVVGTWPITAHAVAGQVQLGAAAATANGTATGYLVIPVCYAMIVRDRNPNAGPFAACFAETMADGSWSSANSQAVVDGAGGNLGWYPHPFYIERTKQTYGGPPRTAGATTMSPYWLLRSPHPMVVAWDPASGKAKSVITSNYQDTTPTDFVGSSSVGGIGSCVRCGSSGFIYTCGPRAAQIAAGSAWGGNGTVAADNTDARKIAWSNQSFSLAGALVWTWGSASGSTVSPGEITYGFPRMAVDKFDNLYLPYAGPGSSSLWIFHKTGSGASAVVISAYAGLPDSNDGYAVAVDPNYPDFTDFASLQRAEFVALGTQQAGASRNSLFKLKTLTITLTAATTRATKLIAVAGGNIATVTPTVITTKGTGATGFATTPTLVMATPFLGNLYLTDGDKTKVYNPRTDTLSDHVATSSGGVPRGYALLTTWNDSLVFARHRDNASQYLIGGQGDPGNFDTDPYTINQAQAILGSHGSAGLPTDIINAFIGWFDDIAIIGGDSTIRMLAGRPSPGSNGVIHLLEPKLGIAFGKAWCIGPGSRLYFFESRGGVYYMDRGGSAIPLSSTTDKNSRRGRIERRLRSINLSVFRIEMAWDDADKALRVKVVPIGVPDASPEHYFWEQATSAWWPDTYANNTLQPTCIDVFDGDDPDDRVVLMGCADGRIRRFDQFVEADNVKRDGTLDANSVAINAKVRIGPIIPKEADFETLFSALEAVLANDQDGAPWISIYCTDRADFLGPAVYTAQLQRGRNPFLNFRRRGALMFIDITSSDRMGRWSVEQLSVMVEPMGIKRLVPR